MRKILIIIAIFFCVNSSAQVYKNKNATVEARVKDLLSKMTMDEKIAYIGGYKDFYIRGIARLDLPEIKLTDGPVGTHKDGRSTAYPASILSAATWDTSLIYNLGKQLGRDSKARGVHILLAPGVNIVRAPMGGRNFEYFSEDPFLTSRAAVAYVKGLQDENVVATVKHYAANNQEWDRHQVSSDMDERTLHEIYLPAFKAAVQEAKAGAIMTSYNLVNGIHTSQHNYLNNEILKKKWGFDGFIMSDWSSTYDGVAAANGGLDLEMPSAKLMNSETLLKALRDGRLKEEIIDDKVRRILRIVFRFGFFDRVQLDRTIPLDNPDGARVALELARGGIVLLKNEKNVLPLDQYKIKTLAVIGPNANAYIAGGGSSFTFPFHALSIADGLRKFGSGVQINYVAGLPTLPDAIKQSVFFTKPGSDVKGLQATYYNNTNLEGNPDHTGIDSLVNIDNGWHIAAENKGIPFDHCSMRWTGVIRPLKSTKYRFSVRGFDGFRLWVNENKAIDAWVDQGITTREVVLDLKAGKEYSVRLEYFARVHPVEISLTWQEDRVNFDDAIRTAQVSDAAIVCVGFNESSERESNDRTFELPPYQDSLITSIARVNPHTIVLLNSGGSAGIGKWIDKVQGLLHIWYSGQEGGTAVAEIIFGKTNPSGKLPVSFEKKWEDNPTFNNYYDPSGTKSVSYKEGIFMGYRYYDIKSIKPRYPFGFGLSYTSFSFRNLTILNKSKEQDPYYSVSFELSNTGNMDGAEVAQLYISELSPTVPRPDKELKAFQKVFLKKGETKKITMELKAAAFSYYNVSLEEFSHNHGNFEIRIGNSSSSIMLKKTIEID